MGARRTFAADWPGASRPLLLIPLLLLNLASAAGDTRHARGLQQLGGGGGGQQLVGTTCSSTGPANIEGCCARKLSEGTCNSDKSCTSPKNLCTPPTPQGPAAGSECISTGPGGWVTCCERKAPRTDPSCPPPTCGTIQGISTADLQACCTKLKKPGSDPTCPAPPKPSPKASPGPPSSPLNVTCYNVTATLEGLLAIQANATQQMGQTRDADKVRTIAAYGLQQMWDFVRNASTAVPTG